MHIPLLPAFICSGLRRMAVYQGEVLFYRKWALFDMGNSLILEGEYPDAQPPEVRAIRKIRLRNVQSPVSSILTSDISLSDFRESLMAVTELRS
jgi:hypothetical protein